MVPDSHVLVAWNWKLAVSQGIQDYQESSRTRWFNSWPFCFLVGGHQQPLEGSRFHSPSQKGHNRRIARKTYIYTIYKLIKKAMSQSQGTSPNLFPESRAAIFETLLDAGVEILQFFATFLALGFGCLWFFTLYHGKSPPFRWRFFWGSLFPSIKTMQISKIYTKNPSPLITPCRPCSPWRHSRTGGSGCLSTCQIIGDANPSVL